MSESQNKIDKQTIRTKTLQDFYNLMSDFQVQHQWRKNFVND
jgi:hypothetical protein